MWLRPEFRHPQPEGMGEMRTSRTLTPWHYLEQWDTPVHTLLLLRAWCIWRATWMGWAKAKPSRMREVDRLLERLEHDIKNATTGGSGRHLLGSSRAHAKLRAWVPHLVTRISHT